MHLVIVKLDVLVTVIVVLRGLVCPRHPALLLFHVDVGGGRRRAVSHLVLSVSDLMRPRHLAEEAISVQLWFSTLSYEKATSLSRCSS